MTTVNTSSIVNTFDNYTWSDATFVWEKPETNWLTYGYTAHSLDVSEPFHLTDVLKVNFSKPLTDSLLLSDGYKQNLTKLLSEISSFSDAYSVVFTKKNYDDLIFSDSYKVNFGLKSSINVSLSDVVKTNLTKKIADSFLLSDTYKPTFTKKLYDDLLLSDSYRTQFVNKFPELFNFSDTLNNLCDFKRTYYDDFLLSDSLKKTISKRFYDDMLFSDSFKRGFDFSISNFGIKTSDLTIDSFTESFNVPFGYSPFQEFLVGEYDYQKAIVRTTIISQDNTSNIGINKLDIHVDIPDTLDRGTAVIPASNTFVPYHKTYYTKPEVQVNINGGVSGQVMVPHVTDITTAGFYIELRDLSNVLVSGQISWTSNGY